MTDCEAKPPVNGALVEIGRFGRPHGLRGQVHLVLGKVGLDVFAELRFMSNSVDASPWYCSKVPECADLPLLYLDDESKLRVSSIRVNANARLVLDIEGIDNRDQAAALTSRVVLMKRADVPAPECGWYISDLVDYEVVDQEGDALGRVVGVLATGGVDVLEIDGNIGPWMLPATEPLVLEVDHDRALIIADPLDGLLPGSDTE